MCACACTHARTQERTHTRTHTCTHACTHERTNTSRALTRMHAHVDTLCTDWGVAYDLVGLSNTHTVQCGCEQQPAPNCHAAIIFQKKTFLIVLADNSSVKQIKIENMSGIRNTYVEHQRLITSSKLAQDTVNTKTKEPLKVIERSNNK